MIVNHHLCLLLHVLDDFLIVTRVWPCVQSSGSIAFLVIADVQLLGIPKTMQNGMLVPLACLLLWSSCVCFGGGF